MKALYLLLISSFSIFLHLNAMITVTSEQELQSALAKAPRALVKFAASWCGACKGMEKLDQKMEDRFQGKITFIKVDIDQATDAAQAHTVQGVPTYLFYKKGTEVARKVGSIQEHVYTQKLDAIAQ